MRSANPLRYSLRHIVGAAALATALLCALVTGCSRKQPESTAEEYARHYRLGIEAYRAGKYNSAIDNFEKALEFDVENHDLYLMLATVYEDLYRDNDARKLEALKQAVVYYEKFLEKSDDEGKKQRVRKWAAKCKSDLIALDERIDSGELDTVEAAEREKTVQETKARIDEIYERVDAIYERKLNTMALESEIEKLRIENAKLTEQADEGGPARSRMSPVGWVILGTLGAVVLALIYALRHIPSSTTAPASSGTARRKDIPVENIIGSYVWVESVHNRGTMRIEETGEGYHIETRALNTNAKSSGEGKYEKNVLEAMLTDDSGEGALMHFEFFEDGRNFVASWEDELGHGSAVGLRNEFDEIVRPDSGEKSGDE